MSGLKKYYFGKRKNKIINNLVAHFKLDGDVTDYVNGNNGSNVGSVSYVTGKLNQGCGYVASSYNTIPHSVNYNFGNGFQDLKYSINLWLSLDAINATSYLVTKRGGSVIPFMVYASASGSTVQFNIYNGRYASGTSISAVCSIPSFNYGVFHMVTFTYDGSSLASGFKIYFNGISIPVTTNSVGTYTTMQLTTTPLCIGNEGGLLASRYTRGIIDEVSIWKNKELSPDEIDYLYNSGAGRAYPF